MARTKVQWMWGDASILGHSAARLNPMRWSKPSSIDEAIMSLSLTTDIERKRPVVLRLQKVDPSSGLEKMPTTQQLPNVEDAIARLEELKLSEGIGVDCRLERSESDWYTDSDRPAKQEETTCPGQSFAMTYEREDVSRSRGQSFAMTYDREDGSRSSSFSLPFEKEVSGSASPVSRSEREVDDSREGDCTPSRASKDRQNLAGFLKKKSHWRKEWAVRFFVMRQDRIDYYLTPPTLMEDENAASRKGCIRLTEAVASAHEGHSYCITAGGETLSCQTLAEQQRWLETINSAAAALARSRISVQNQEAALITGLMASKLWLIPPNSSDEMVRLGWRKMSCVDVSGNGSSVVLLLGEGNVQAACRLSLCDVPAGSSCEAPVHLLCEDDHEHSRELRLSVKVHTILQDARPTNNFMSYTIGLCVLVLALMVACCGLLIFHASIFDVQKKSQPVKHRMQFSAEKVMYCDSERAPAPLAPLTTKPGWVGKWTLDKTCSEPYAPILEDLTVNYILRKGLDACTSSMIISTSPTHLILVVTLGLTITDTIPLDGSFTAKLVPKGSKMKGECQIKVTKATSTELETYTVFPDGFGTLRDTLTMHEDGNAFSRVVVRGPFKVTRVFRRT